MRNFLSYYFDRPLSSNGGKMWTTLNITWFLSTLLFTVLFIYGGYKYASPMLYLLSGIPFTLMIYNFVDEYNNFKKLGYSKIIAIVFYGIIFLDLFVTLGLLLFY